LIKLATRTYQKSRPISSDFEAVTRNNQLNMSRITWNLILDYEVQFH